MNFKLLLFTLLLTFSLQTIAQEKVSNTSSGITSFEVETDNIEELRNFKWSTVLEMIRENPDNDTFDFSMAFINPENKKEGEIKYDNFKFKISGKSSNVEELVERSKKIVQNFITAYDKQHS
ncbi:hypothetical protein [Zunongwangia endophytica]|uniref:Uncharacterized protein n=1 Tax=Zunongwangia endophytica TaxID=1808945 RepID=A0ABV8HBP3_9FLAO|nr:hypothetical protein [Zunongwangia endophytica]MDN3593518.1 hypothetical protein [Zunongwangia endophytica]